VRGTSRADLLFKTPEPVTRLQVTLATGAVPADVVVTAGGQRMTRRLAPGDRSVVDVPIGPGFPYRGTRVWPVTIAVDSGFVPMFTGESLDHRYLGVLVTPSDPFMVGRRESAPAVRICFGPPRDHDELRRGLGTLTELLREGPAYSFSNVV